MGQSDLEVLEVLDYKNSVHCLGDGSAATKTLSSVLIEQMKEALQEGECRQKVCLCVCVLVLVYVCTYVPVFVRVCRLQGAAHQFHVQGDVPPHHREK